jgi:NAD(P)-dependent dehydrogenase (short-subunit alcohol dehydrogenase family)
MPDSPRWPTTFAGNLLPVELIDAQDVSNAVVFLASDAARYITGLEMTVDAGFTCKV